MPSVASKPSILQAFGLEFVRARHVRLQALPSLPDRVNFINKDDCALIFGTLEEVPYSA